MPAYFATVARGLEAVAASELERLGATRIEPAFGGVQFEGDLALLYRSCLWLRTATRVLRPLREFAARTPEMLFDQIRRIKWEQYLTPESTFAIDCKIARGSKDVNLQHSKFAALKIKDAIVDQMRMKLGARASIDVENPDLRIAAYISGGRCALSLDASGASLHERGYRARDTGAPLKETLAAGIVELTGWDGKTPFLDPMCGSGTLVIEAALKALGIAPGLFRDRFGFFGWPDFDEGLWRKTVEEARASAHARADAPIVGYDLGRDAITTALENARRAGLSKSVHFEKRSVEKLDPVGQGPGTLVVNPPYGERLGDVEELKGLYKLLGDLFKQRMKGWTAFIFTGNRELAKCVGLHASRRIELFNGPIECRLLKYDLY
jgi:putative N6-adenine-specific DNA methylase